MGTRTDQVPKQRAVTDFLAHVSSDDDCIVSSETCLDGSAFVVVVRDARASGRTFLGTTPLSVFMLSQIGHLPG